MNSYFRLSQFQLLQNLYPSLQTASGMSVLTGVVFFKLFRSGVGDQSHLSNFPMCKESTFNTLFDLILSMR